MLSWATACVRGCFSTLHRVVGGETPTLQNCNVQHGGFSTLHRVVGGETVAHRHLVPVYIRFSTLHRVVGGETRWRSGAAARGRPGFSTLHRVVGGETYHHGTILSILYVSVLSIESLGVKLEFCPTRPYQYLVSVLSIESLGVKHIGTDPEFFAMNFVSVLSIESLGVKQSSAP